MTDAYLLLQGIPHLPLFQASPGRSLQMYNSPSLCQTADAVPIFLDEQVLESLSLMAASCSESFKLHLISDQTAVTSPASKTLGSDAQ